MIAQQRTNSLVRSAGEQGVALADVGRVRRRWLVEQHIVQPGEQRRVTRECARRRQPAPDDGRREARRRSRLRALRLVDDLDVADVDLERVPALVPVRRIAAREGQIVRIPQVPDLVKQVIRQKLDGDARRRAHDERVGAAKCKAPHQ
jgi:hypothetical protein